MFEDEVISDLVDEVAGFPGELMKMLGQILLDIKVLRQ